VTPNSIVQSIAIGNPADGRYALMIARQSGGGAHAVSDDEAMAGVRLLAQTEGIFADPAGGVVIGVLKELATSGIIKRKELTVAFVTGAGPRTQEILTDIVRPVTVQPNLKSVEQSLKT
jgi:threonine synthase